MQAGLSVHASNRRSIFLGASPAVLGLGLEDSIAGLLLRRGETEAHGLTTDDTVRPKSPAGGRR